MGIRPTIPVIAPPHNAPGAKKNASAAAPTSLFLSLAMQAMHISLNLLTREVVAYRQFISLLCNIHLVYAWLES